MQELDINIKPLFVGHVSCDLVDGNCVLGGAVAYASTLSAQLGIQSTVLTSCSPDYEGLNLLRSMDVEVINDKSERTTTFTNIYMGSERTQYIAAVADKIRCSTLDKNKEGVDFVFIAPIAQEFEPKLIAELHDMPLLACSIQGWLRNWDDEGKVKACQMDWRLLSDVDIIFLSEEDIDGLDNAREELLGLNAIIVITESQKGAKIYQGGKMSFYPSYPSDLLDATGAGDIYATAFLINYIQKKDVTLSAIFAHCVASIAIENKGMVYPDLIKEIEKRVAHYTTLFPL